MRFNVSSTEPSLSARYATLAVGLLLGRRLLMLYSVATGRVPNFERARTIDPQDVTVTFNDVAGVDDAKDEVGKSSTSSKSPGHTGWLRCCQTLIPRTR